jgi:hypothetical protein
MSHVSKNYVKAITEGASWLPTEKEALTECSDQAPVTEAHVCPLCQSNLAEPISEEALLEHSAAMLEVFTAVEDTLNESLEESEEDDSDEESEEDSEDDGEEYDEEEYDEESEDEDEE